MVEITLIGDSMPSLKQIPGMELETIQRLRSLGISSSMGLLEKGMLPAGRKRIAEYLGVSSTQILKWVCLSDLLRIKGITNEYALFLLDIGIITSSFLSGYKPEELYSYIKSVSNGSIRISKLPTLNQITNWISQASSLQSDIWLDGMYCYGVKGFN